MNDLTLIEREGKLLVDSRLVAEELSLNHKSLVETINKHSDIIESNFGVLMFETAKPQNNENGGGRPPTVVYLTKEQARFVASLSRNNPKVVEFKAHLVAAYNAAEKLVERIDPDQLDREQILVMALDSERKRKAAEAALEIATPKVEGYDRWIYSEGTYCITEGLKRLGMHQKGGIVWLKQRGILFMNDTQKVRIEYITNGWFVNNDYTQTLPDGRVKTRSQARMTKKGLEELRKLAIKDGIIPNLETGLLSGSTKEPVDDGLDLDNLLKGF